MKRKGDGASKNKPQPCTFLPRDDDEAKKNPPETAGFENAR